jgi:hypothetical protein
MSGEWCLPDVAPHEVCGNAGAKDENRWLLLLLLFTVLKRVSKRDMYDGLGCKWGG